MKVEMVGGPKDGDAFEVPDHFQQISFPILNNQTTTTAFSKDQAEMMSMRTLTLDIITRRNGAKIVIWKEI